MIGGLLFRYWEGGARARQEQSNVRVEWLRKSKRPEAASLAEPDSRGAVLVPIQIALTPAAVTPRAGRAAAEPCRGAAVTYPAAAVPVLAGRLTCRAAVARVRTALPDSVLLRAPAPKAVPLFRWGADWLPLAEYNTRARAVLAFAGGGALPAPFGSRPSVDEHNRQAVVAIAAAMLADDA